MKAEAHSKAKGRAAKKPVVKDTDKTSSTACSVARKNPKARSDAPSKALLKAAGLDEGSGRQLLERSSADMVSNCPRPLRLASK